MNQLEPTVDCIYTCYICGTIDRTVKVRARKSTENIIYWVQNVAGIAVALDHNAISPKCEATKMAYIKIPINNNIAGGPVRQ